MDENPTCFTAAGATERRELRRERNLPRHKAGWACLDRGEQPRSGPRISYVRLRPDLAGAHASHHHTVRVRPAIDQLSRWSTWRRVRRWLPGDAHRHPCRRDERPHRRRFPRAERDCPEKSRPRVGRASPLLPYQREKTLAKGIEAPRSVPVRVHPCRDLPRRVDLRQASNMVARPLELAFESFPGAAPDGIGIPIARLVP